MSPPVPRIEPAELVERYDVVLLDSYGVLVDEHGALPGAAALLHRLHDAGRRFVARAEDGPWPGGARHHLAWAPDEIVAHIAMTTGIFGQTMNIEIEAKGGARGGPACRPRHRRGGPAFAA